MFKFAVWLLLLLPTIIVGVIMSGANLPLLLTVAAALLPAAGVLLFERRNQQRMTARTHDFIQRLIDVIPQPVYVKDAQSVYQIVNKAFAEERGMTTDQIVGTSSFALSPNSQTSEDLTREDTAALQGEFISLEKHALINGKDRYQLVMKGACLNIDGQQVIVGANFNITPWRLAERQLALALEQQKDQNQRTMEYIQRVIDVIPYPVYVKDAQSRYLLVNQAMAQSKGVSADALLGKMGMAEDTSTETLTRHFMEDGKVLAGQSVFKEEHGTTRLTGKAFHRIITKGASFDSDGNRIIVGAHFDLTDLRIAEKNLQEALAREVELRLRSQNFVQQIIDLIPDPVYIKNRDSRYLMLNHAFAKERGKPKEMLIGMTSFDLAPNSDTAETSAREDHDVIEGGEVTKEQHTALPITGEECYRVVFKRRCIYLDGTPAVFGLHHYITRWKIAALEFQHLSWKDPLTGIANRRHFSDEAEKAIALAGRSGSPLGLAMLDLDHFKKINDQYGHPVGDAVLVEMVRRCQTGLRSSDVIGRWGGEEFIIFFPFTTLDATALVAERLRIAIADTPFSTASGDLHVTISGGLALWQPGEKLGQLIGRADTALYQAKRDGRNRICGNQN